LAADISSLAYLAKIVCHHSLLCKFAFSVTDAQRMGLFSCIVPGGRAWNAAALMTQVRSFFFSFCVQPPSLASYATRVVPAFFPSTTRVRLCDAGFFPGCFPDVSSADTCHIP
jgi:hypothetical protein